MERLEALKERTRYDPAEVETRIMDEWLAAGYFHPEARGTSKENFSIAIPPPNVTGALHMGHALNGTLQDALIRIRRMQGQNTMWILGTDHAGIATQAVVQKEVEAEGLSLDEIGREEFVRRVWQWKDKYGSTIIEQFKRLGASCDYERERFTLDEGYVRAVYRVFKALFDRGYIHRDTYMVNWDPGGGTAISDLEVEYRDVDDTLYHITYPLASVDGSIVVATVRPETMLADTAVAVSPNDRRFADLVGQEAVLPLVGRRLPIVADEHVDPEFGTGAVKITPGHDPNDFEIGRRHQLEVISVIGEDGRLTDQAGERFAGLAINEGRQAVVQALNEEGLITRAEPYRHSVGHSHRSGEPIEPLVSEQWFCRMDELAKPAMEVVENGRVRFVPEQWKRVYLDLMQNLRPWCISRQLWWGHRLPVWYCEACEETYVAEQAPERCGACDGTLRQETDVLDTWFSSALWPFATLGWPDSTPELKAFYPTDFLTTARDIIFLWVARMIMMGLEFAGDVPFSDVYVHSLILAPDGRRMSKSLGTGVDPLDPIEEHGADALRFGLMAMSSAQDVRYSAEKVQQGQELANKLWNASRLILLNVDDVEPAPQTDELADRWILSRLQGAIKATRDLYDTYDFAHVALDLYDFFWHDLCDWYLELVKPRLYEAESKANVSANLLKVLSDTLALLHPIMPFVTEAIYGFFPPAARPAPHLTVRSFPEPDPTLVDEEAERHLNVVREATVALRQYREQVGVPAKLRVRARLVCEDEKLDATYQRSLEVIERLARFDFQQGSADVEVEASVAEVEASVAEVEASVAVPAVAVPGATVQILPTEGLDPAEAARRMDARRAKVKKEIERAERKLSNRGFVGKAPADLVEAERGKLERYRRELERLLP